MQYEIKELELGGILDHSIRLYKEHFVFVATIVCIVFLPITLVLGLAMAAMSPTEAELANATPGAMAAMGTTGLIGLLFIPLTMALGLITQGAICYGIAYRYLGSEMAAGEAIGRAFRRITSLAGAAMVTSILIGLGTLALVIPGIYLWLIWYIVVPALMFENLPAMASLGRSKRLMRDQMGKAFVLGFILLVVGFAAGFSTALVPNAFLEAAVQSLVNALVVGFNAVAVTVFYFSSRCKHENFDLELLAQALGGTAGDEPPAL